ncbi:MAG: hypothetical protein AAF518_24415 [Spirochaetota bacterium]
MDSATRFSFTGLFAMLLGFVWLTGMLILSLGSSVDLIYKLYTRKEAIVSTVAKSKPNSWGQRKHMACFKIEDFCDIGYFQVGEKVKIYRYIQFPELLFSLMFHQKFPARITQPGIANFEGLFFEIPTIACLVVFLLYRMIHLFGFQGFRLWKEKNGL